MIHPEWEQEQERLDRVLLYISSLIKRKFREKDHLVELEQDINRSMWEDTGSIQDLESIADFMQHINLLKQNMAWAKKTSQEIKRLDKQLLNPYFGRIDFLPDQGNPEKIYIGVHTLFHDESGEILIYDWRAPVSGMFYDYEPGRASYKCPAGVISGEITLKRQFRISGGKIELMFDSGVTIQDDILQEILSGNTSGKMKTIVSTIQREQNTAIRHEATKVLAVQGMAGSGKTSVAMHRASYLLYRHKKVISKNNLVILSSTGVLGEYISDVLPELGEEEIKGITYTDIFRKYGPKGFKAETQPQMMEQLLESQASRELRSRHFSVGLKSSPDFVKVIHRLFNYSLKHLIRFEDITLNNQMIAPRKELHNLFFIDFAQMSVAQRFKRINHRISERLKPFKNRKESERIEAIESDNIHLSHREARALSRAYINQEMSSLNDRIERMLAIDPVVLYSSLFSSDEIFNACFEGIVPQDSHDLITAMRLDTVKNLNEGKIPFEDSGPVLLLSLLLGLSEPDNSVKHLLIDEAQDYSSIQLCSLSRLFPSAGVTLLGDRNQNISLGTQPLTLKDAAYLLAPDDHAFLTLEKSYRSTVEITRFSSQFLSAPSGEAYGRHGKKPVVITSRGMEKMIESISDILRSEISEGRKTMALITKTLNQAHRLYHLLKKSMSSVSCPFRLMDEAFEYDIEGILVVPSYLAKGLEFDTVLVVLEDKDDYSRDEEKGLFYTVLSRALHELCILWKEPYLPSVLDKVDPSLYDLLT